MKYLGILILLSIGLSTYSQANDWFLNYPEYEIKSYLSMRDSDKKDLSGNKLKLISEGKEVHDERSKLIKNAKRSIYISAFAFKPDQTGLATAWELCQQAKKGIDVRILLDDYGSKKMRRWRSSFRECNIRLVFFNPVRWGLTGLPKNIHEKLFIVDGEHMLIGGNGYGNHYYLGGMESKRWYDLELKVSGPAACHMHNYFVQTWEKTIKKHLDRIHHYDNFGNNNLTYEEKQELRWFEYSLSRPLEKCREVKHGKSNAIALYNNPFFETKKRPLIQAYKQAISSLEPGEKVYLYSPYFAPGKSFTKFLTEQAHRGVDISIVTNSSHSSDEGFAIRVTALRRAKYLMKHGVKVYMWNRKNTMHRKAGVFGDRWAYVGSDNLDNRGQEYQSESILFTDDEKIVAQVQQQFDHSIKNSFLLNQKTAKKFMSNFTRIKKWISGRIERWL